MIFYLIPIAVIIISLLAILFIIAKNLPGIAAINTDSIAKEKDSKVRNKIMLERMNRKVIEGKRLFNDISKPIKEVLRDVSKNLHQKAVEMERETLKKSPPLKKIDLAQEISDKLEAIEKFMADQSFEEAEEMCISILEISSENMSAFELLADIYIETKDYKKARETLKFLIKIVQKNNKKGDPNAGSHRLANAYANLGWVYQLEGRNNFALTNYKRAVALEGNNPRFLDLLLKISIILKDKNLAIEAFNNLEKANPDNQKLPEIKEEIEKLA